MSDITIHEYIKQIKDGHIEYRDGRLYRKSNRVRVYPEPFILEGNVRNNGYRVHKFDRNLSKKKNFFEHHIVWVLFNGDLPENATIVHKNGIRTDNRIENLELQ